jgi:hypothetical protein
MPIVVDSSGQPMKIERNCPTNWNCIKMRIYPKIAAYHSGPYLVAAILSDPGRIGRGCGAVTTREVGVLNYQHNARDQTAKNCHHALLACGLPLSTYLPLNAVPWFNGNANQPSLREGANYNAALIREHCIERVLLLGKVAQKSHKYLCGLLPKQIAFSELPHPGGLGLRAYKLRLGLATYPDAQAAFFEAFGAAAVR